MANDSQSKQNDSDVKQGLLAAYRRFMGPLVRILIRNGISFNEFADELKGVFVEVAQDDFPIDDRNPSGTRIAILTGLTRKEVKRQLEMLDGEDAKISSDPNRVMRVLNGWHSDADYIGPYGLPLELDFESQKDGRPSFTELVKNYSGDMSPRAMLDELLRTKAAEMLHDGSLRVLTRTHVTSDLDPAVLARLGSIIKNLAETLDNNFFEATEKNQKRFERNVYTEIGINSEVMDDFKLLVQEKGQRFIDTMGHFLTSNEGTDLSEHDKADIKAGVEIYLYVDKD